MRMVPLGGRTRIIHDLVRDCYVFGPCGAGVSFAIQFVTVSSARWNWQRSTRSNPLFFVELMVAVGP